METKQKEKQYEIACLIGRFQVHMLHAAHRQLIDKAIDKHKKVIIFLGVSPILGTIRNPLDFDSRKRMIQDSYPDVVVMSLPDRNSDKIWSSNVDQRIREIFPIGNAIIYGGRDSFIPHYTGKFDVAELDTSIYVSGTEIRKQLSEEIKSSEDWRAGAIYNAYNTFPTSFQTVDIAPFRNEGIETEVLLAKKPFESKYRFVGGFVDPTDSSLEKAAQREFNEETLGNIHNLKYVGSYRIDDWRYRNERDKIMTTLFSGTVSKETTFTPSDDISELQWFRMIDLCNEGAAHKIFVDEHVPLAISIIGNFSRENKFVHEETLG